jgi:hypothetical protein
MNNRPSCINVDKYPRDGNNSVYRCGHVKLSNFKCMPHTYINEFSDSSASVMGLYSYRY